MVNRATRITLPLPEDTSPSPWGLLHQEMVEQNRNMETIIKLQGEILRSLTRSIPEPIWVSGLKDSVDKLGIALIAVVKPKNPVSIKTRRILVDTAGTPKQFPEVKVPYDYSVVVKALRGNTDNIYIAPARQDATEAASRIPLAAGESVELQIEDLSSLWIDAAVSGEGAVWVIESSEDAVVTRG